MPIIVRDYTWTQTSSCVYITVPLRGANPKKADVYVNDAYLKINFPPYLFELDLFDQIDTDKAVVSVGNGCTKFELPKLIEQTWENLSYPKDSAIPIKTRREEADLRFRQKAEEARQRKAAERRQEEQLLIQKQIEVERAERERLASLKEAEKRQAEEGLNKWMEQTKLQNANREREDVTRRKGKGKIEESGIVEIFDKDDGYISDDSVMDKRHENESTSAECKASVETKSCKETEDLDDLDDESGLDMEEIRAKVQAQLKQQRVPPPRGANQEIHITFTSRGLIPTKTARESEDVKWRTRIKAMQDEHRRKADISDARSIEESNPTFLKDKGNSFYRSGNYAAAVNAYTAALDIDPSNFTCLSNRAACHLQLNAYDACVQDCTTALSLLSKEEEAIREETVEDVHADDRRKSRVKMLVRIGTAKVRSGELKAGLEEYQRALQLDPRNEMLQRDVENLMQSI
ncbi:uncharacterized protein SPPG_01312 [Spizellomyces punctatus DAOM BR117]|uniref:Dynein axonemal assembly factor 4 n=1 Tax=Spizellomyces punctatus (strain DAOM BR117) TaxID=645134 RepID=A0A0L0HRV3_SPIPD|nr:uncharacterized protein SPPG_01312 [Spizellomyces punctatus DAOM BR117]KND03858.1 hypothetical protein SPPG_01312 [Spizellomyces punctatus DAOM BR117]|eukprot:XP_016611897.1 hypothetical protein SPPG_01312 [Spizellomyces punctatus DAOM BR117]